MKGVDNVLEVAEILVSSELAKQKGAWIEYEGQKLQGLEKLYQALKNNKEMYKKAIEKIKTLKLNVYGLLTNENNISYDDIPQEQ